jgi:hypothetical protein
MLGLGNLALLNTVSATQIDSNAVTTVKINNAAVTLAKMADIATASFIGRSTALTGVPEVLTVTSAKTMLGVNLVNNTSDANKPVSTAQQTALDGKLSLTGGTMSGSIGLLGGGYLEGAPTYTLIGKASNGLYFLDDSIALSNAAYWRTALNVDDGAAADQTAVEIEDLYDSLVPQISGPEITSGTVTSLRTVSPADLKSFVTQHAGGGGDLSAADINTFAELDAIVADVTLVHSASTWPLSQITGKGDLAALNTVGTTQIDNAAVTLAKLANIATDTFIGRDTAGTGVPEAITVTSAQAMLGLQDLAFLDTVSATGIATNAVTSPKILDGAVTTTKILDGAVTLAKLANIATDSFIGRDTAGTGVPEALTATQVRTIINVADGATANQSDATLKARANHTGTQTLSTISDSGALAAKNTVATGDIDNAAVTLAKITNIATDSFIGRDTAGTGVPEVITVTSAQTMLGLGDLAFLDEIASNAVTTSKILDGAVTLAKMANIATASFVARESAGTGVPQVLDVTSARALLGVLATPSPPAGGKQRLIATSGVLSWETTT